MNYSKANNITNLSTQELTLLRGPGEYELQPQ